MHFLGLFFFVLTSSVLVHFTVSQNFNPTILQDTRDLPKVDGTFGFLYRTEDGIAHAAKGDPDGVIHGRFSYTDPTGLKVNYNYNAGSRVAPGYTEPAAERQYQPPQQNYRTYKGPQYGEPQQPQYEKSQQHPQYVQSEPEYVPRTRPSARSERLRPQYSAQYREPEIHEARRPRPTYSSRNEVYDA